MNEFDGTANAGRKGIAYDWQSLYAAAQAATIDAELVSIAGKPPGHGRLITQVEFLAAGPVLVLGCGFVARCRVPLLIAASVVDPRGSIFHRTPDDTRHHPR
jgi:hypothetical protein